MSIEQKHRFKQVRKNTMQLAVEEKQSSQRTGIRLIGIASTLREYRLCYFLNKMLRADFVRKEDLELKTGERQMQVYSRYLYKDLQNQITYLLFSNKAPGGLLQPQLAQFDYLLRIKGKPDKQLLQHLMTSLRQTQQVVLVAEIDSRKLKDVSKLRYVERKAPARKPLSSKKLVELMRH